MVRREEGLHSRKEMWHFAESASSESAQCRELALKNKDLVQSKQGGRVFHNEKE